MRLHTVLFFDVFPFRSRPGGEIGEDERELIKNLNLPEFWSNIVL